MGSAVSNFVDGKNENNPNHVIIAPNLSGFNRVIISLPDNFLSIDDILSDLVEFGYLDGIEQHEKVENNHYVIKRKNEYESKLMINYLNNKFGYIADIGYVKPSRNIVIDQNKHGVTTTDQAKSAHIALIQSPIAQNPNQQFSAFRREYDVETEFPKFERVNIEQIIHYTRPQDIVNNINNNNNNYNNYNNNNNMTNALDAMTKGVEFDITETEAVKDRDAVKIDYVEKARKLRLQLKNSKLKSLKKVKTQKRICEQFKYDHMNQLIELKRKKYGIKRTKRIYDIQREERLKMAEMKQKIDPNFKPNEYNKHQKQFWEDFDYNNKQT